MSRARTKLQSGAIALFVGAATFPLLLVAIVGGLFPIGFEPPDLLVACLLTSSGWGAYEAFRRTFNFLCERWSEDREPPRIREWRPRRNVVRST